MTREPSAAGQFYEENFIGLEEQIKGCFHHRLGPGALPIKKRKGILKAAIVPHAGYMFSGPCAAWAYKEIAESEISDIYVLIGPNHSGAGSSASIEDWKTPFGFIKTDKDFVREIGQNTDIQINDSYHENEHSVEVQLPFLQYVNKEFLKQMKFAAITLSNDIDIKKFANDLKKIIIKSKKKITFIISSDFVHYGANYNYKPFIFDVDDKLKELDSEAFKLILEKKPEDFLDYIKKTGATICGYLSIYLLLKLIDDEKGRLLMYYNSSEISGDKKNTVSYASIIFK